MTNIIADQIQIELNKLKFFAKRLQHKLNISRTEALNLIAFRYFNVPSWSLVRNRLFSGKETELDDQLTKIGALNVASGATHISNFAYSFRYWISVGKPSAHEVHQNDALEQSYVIRTVFEALAQCLGSKEGREKFYSIEITKDEAQDFLIFSSQISKYADYLDEEYQKWQQQQDGEIELYIQNELERDMWDDTILDNEVTYNSIGEVANGPTDVDDAYSLSDQKKILKSIEDAMNRSYVDFDMSKAFSDYLNSPESEL